MTFFLRSYWLIFRIWL